MKRWIWVFLIVACIAQANELQDRVKDIVGRYDYQTHSKLIKMLFANEAQYYNDGKINYNKTLHTLRSNGLLKLAVTNSNSVDINFLIPKNPIKTIKILNSTIKNMGYYYFFTKTASYDDDQIFRWTITLKTKNIIDPIGFLKQLKKHNITVTHIKKLENQNWQYDLDTRFSRLTNLKKIKPNSTTVLAKPFKEYFVSVSSGVDMFHIKSFSGDIWYPYVVCFDKNLKPLKAVRSSKATAIYRQVLPKGTQYIKIGDNFNIKNIKRGLTIITK